VARFLVAADAILNREPRASCKFVGRIDDSDYVPLSMLAAAVQIHKPVLALTLCG